MPGYGYRGRYGSGTPDDEERGGLLKALMSRSWFLIIPLMGVVWANARQVTPQVKLIKQTQAQEEKAIEQERTRTLTLATPIRSRISALAALGDTFDVRFARIDSLTDNIMTFLKADREAAARLEFQIDSLSQVFAEANTRSTALSDTLQRLVTTADSLKAVIADRNAQAESLWAETVQNLDMADRIMNPAKYRKNTALVTGEGDFPNRDALPKR